MIDAYAIGVSLTMNPQLTLGPLAEVMDGFMRLQKVVQDTQIGINDMLASLRGGAHVADSFAEAMERAEQASRGFRPPNMGGGALPPKQASGGPRMIGEPGGAQESGGGAMGAVASMAFRGAVGVQVASMTVHGVQHMIVDNSGVAEKEFQLHAAGISPAEIEWSRNKATEIATSGKYPGVEISEIMDIFRSLRSVFGENTKIADPLQAAKDNLEKAVEVTTALKSTIGSVGESDLHTLFRTVEMRAHLSGEDGTVDPAKFNTEMDETYKTLEAAAKMLTPRDLFNLVRQAGPMARFFENPAQFWDQVMGAALEMKGERTGTSIAAVGRQFLGDIMTKQRADELKGLGLLDEGDYKAIRGGSPQFSDAGQKKLEGYLSGGFFNFFEIIKTAMASHGKTSNEDQMSEIYRIFGTDTVRRIAAIFTQDSGRLQKEAALREQTPGPGAAVDMARNESVKTSVQGVDVAIKNLFATLENAGKGPLIGTLNALSSAINFLTSTARVNDGGGVSGIIDSFRHLFGGDDMQEYFKKKYLHNESYAPGGKSDGAVQLRGDINFDGRKMGSYVANAVADGLNRPSRGGAMPDLRASPYPAASGAVAT